MKTKLNQEEKLDIQIRQAMNDIADSHRIIAGLQTLDPLKFPFIESTISFHELRIKNCSDAVKKYFYRQENVEKRLKSIATQLKNLKAEIRWQKTK